MELGRIGAPYGIKGWAHVDSYTDPPAALLDYRQWSLRLAGERLTRRVLEGHTQGEGLVAHLESVEDRNAAAALTGAVIEVRRAELPSPGERQHYEADLIGLQVLNLEGIALGAVSHFVHAPTGAVMVVKSAEGGEHWVLATPQYLRKVELDQGLIRVDWPVEP